MGKIEDNEDELYVETVKGKRYSFGFICRQTGETVTLQLLESSLGWENGNISEKEKARIRKLFDKDGNLIS